MRVYIILIAVLATLVAFSGTVSAVTNFRPANAASLTSISYENDHARFLGKKEPNDANNLHTEERGAIKDALKKVYGMFSKKQKALHLLNKSKQELLSKKVLPSKLTAAIERLKKAGASEEQITKFTAKARAYDVFHSRNTIR
ncbi:unnamed protein product [Phytophthora fragariaefolia]|uniref:RxLR effector protein n=1 Tax=Phytophthora fragariaefolia TaxID=1490495 RepID=A0A9W7D3R9_9STRA|nr:unnamed protein product [Phytophthora fragariaefolia]